MKVKISEVQSFVDEQKKQIDTLNLGLSEIETNINQVIQMESFRGKAASAAKMYYHEYHSTLIRAFIGLFNQLESHMTKHLNDFHGKVDADDQAVIDIAYIDDQEDDILEMYKQLEDISRELAETIKNVSDLTSAQTPSFSHVMSTNDETVEVTSKVVEDLTAFTKTGKADQYDIESSMAEIERLMKAGQRKSSQSKTPEWFQLQLPTIQSAISEAKKNEAFASVLSDGYYRKSVLNQTSDEQIQFGQSELRFQEYMKGVSFDDQLRMGMGWFANSQLGRTLLHYRMDSRFQFLYSFATKENLRAVGALESWWNKTITYQVDLSKIRLLTVGFAGL
ncbi:T7SS effector LXG polymorphic toxin, partial [Metabacillus lacus]